MFDFQSPLFLILLAAIPILIYIQLRTSVIAAKWRKHITFLLRTAALLCIILALANLQRTDREHRLAVGFLIDTSGSIAPSQQEIAINQINTAIAKLKPTDQYAVISYAKERSIVIGMGQVDQQPTLTSALVESSADSDGTDILTALRRSLDLFPDNYHRRIVLFSDGINNFGNSSVKDYLPLFKSSDVEIMSVPLQTVDDAIRVRELQLPDKVRKGQQFRMQAIVESDGSIPTVTATLYHNDIPYPDIEFTLREGKNVLTLPSQKLTKDRPHTFHLKLNISDEIQENNQVYGVVHIQDKPHILYAEGDLERADSLKMVLDENGFIVNVISAAAIPTELVSLQQNDVLILSNVSADALSSEQKDIIEVYVRDLGHGLVATGGDKAFGAGRWMDTALERVLPVEMTPRERQESVALVFVIDTSGSMANYVGSQQKIKLAIEGIRAGIRNLEDDDQAAILGFDVNQRNISPLTSDHDALIRAVGRLKPTGGTTAMDAAVETAGNILKTAETQLRHIILLSDVKSAGDPDRFIETAQEIVDARIGITVIGIGDADEKLLQKFEDHGIGQSVHVRDVRELPEVLMDAVRETQSYIVQEVFEPTINNQNTPILDGITDLPKLNGYVATAEKTAAQVILKSHKDEPVLAVWNYGLGKSVAWTSDVKPAWSADWIAWDNFGKFWGQVVNWTLPTAGSEPNFDLVVSSANGSGHVVIETQQSSPAAYVVQVAGPNGSSQSVEMEQESSTRYVGAFQMSDSGSYIVTAEHEDDGSRQTETISLSYPAEYADFDVNRALLTQLAEDTGGIYEPTATQIAAPAGDAIEKRVSLSTLLLIIAVVLFVLEMILRRFSVMRGYLSELRGQSESVIPDALSQLKQKKEEVSIGSDSGVYSTVESVSLRERITVPDASAEEVEGTVVRLLAAKRRSQSV